MSVAPTKLTLKKESHLTVEWADGITSRFAIEMLRANCPCATCRDVRAASGQNRLRVLSAARPDDGRLIALSAEPVGNYALRIHWNDGHSAGIYSFEFLRELGKDQNRNQSED